MGGESVSVSTFSPPVNDVRASDGACLQHICPLVALGATHLLAHSSLALIMASAY